MNFEISGGFRKMNGAKQDMKVTGLVCLLQLIINVTQKAGDRLSGGQ